MFMGLAWTFGNFAPSLPSPQRDCGLELRKIDSNRKAGFRDYFSAGGTAPSGERFLWDRPSREGGGKGIWESVDGPAFVLRHRARTGRGDKKFAHHGAAWRAPSFNG
jgi:hypothetical protein